MPQRAIIHCMHEEERMAGEQLPGYESSTESFVIADITPDEEKRLKERGIFVEYIREPDEADIQPDVDTTRPKIKSFRAVRPGDETKSTYIVQLRGPILEEHADILKSQTVELREAIGRNLYLASLTPTQYNVLNNERFVLRIVPHFAESTAPTATLRSVNRNNIKMLSYDVRVDDEDPQSIVSVVDWLEAKHVTIAGSTKRKVRVYLPELSPILDDILALDDVLSVEEYVEPKVRNDRARTILGVDSSGAVGSRALTQTGNGQIVGVADTGVDSDHPDLKNNIQGTVALGRPGKSDDPDGHGTHVCGSVAGDGTASGGKIKGIAPGAKLFVQSLLDSAGKLSGLPLDLNDLFDEAYREGVRIHNNSWGAETRSKYVGTSLEVDEFVWKNPDCLILFAIGNEGQAAIRIRSQIGFVDWLSANSPASAKNSLSVGASRSDRTTGGYSKQTWRTSWPKDFPDDPIGKEFVSGDPECLAGFSSRGPSDDRRILPHVVAPGTDIVSTKSSIAPIKNYWGPYSTADYAYNGGTSMACPIVAGCAALIREYLVSSRNHANPSAALLKALLVNSTSTLKGLDALADHGFVPNYHQGFGRINMSIAIPEQDDMLAFRDTLSDPTQKLTMTGRRRRYRFTVQPGTQELRICLSWTDPPGRAIQNQMNLFLEQPNGRKFTGNENLPNSLGIPDPDNNTQIIRIENPLPGSYLVQVSATNLLKPPQDFALVVYGDLNAAGLVPA